MNKLAFVILVVSSVARAQQIATREGLDALLDDAILMEDFEGISIHGSTSISAHSPLNSVTKPTWGLVPDVTYTSSGDYLMLFGGYLNGDSSNILEAFWGDLEIIFNQQELGVGFDVVNGTGNLTFIETVSFYHGATVLGTVVLTIGPASFSFVGWHDSTVGITSVRIVGDPVEEIDNVEWGVVVDACAPFGDMNRDGFIRGNDIQPFIDCVLIGDAGCTCAEMDGTAPLTIADVQVFVAALLAG